MPQSHQHPAVCAHDPKSARGSLKLALAITTAFMIVEFIGGLFTNSLALLADSAHMLTDVAALGLSILASTLAARRATPAKTYGYHRAEILAALLNGVLLVLIALGIFYEAFQRLAAPPEVRAGWMFVIAAFGLAANLASALFLSRHHHHSLNVRSAFFHVLADAAGSVGAIAASLLIYFGGYAIADPVISIVVGLLVLSSSWMVIRDSVDILLEGTPAHVNIVLLQDRLRAVPGITSVHDLHVWTLTSGVLAMSCHVVASEGTEQNGILVRLRSVAREQFGIDHTTVQVETGESEMSFEECTCHFGAWDSRT